MSANITKEEYVIWVKGSLSRWLGARLSENGDTAPPYRGWVKEFQAVCNVCTRNGDVDENTQNALIKANHRHDRYVSWVQQSLNVGMQGAAQGSAAVMNPQTIAAIKKFQTANDLEPNGWVGAKTETVLRKKTGQKPPVTPPKSTPSEFPRPWGGRTPRELAAFWSEQYLLEPVTTPPASYSGISMLAHQMYLRAFLKALWRPDADTEYVPGNTVPSWINAGRLEPAFGGIDNKDLPHAFHNRWLKDALKDLIQQTKFIMDVENWSYAHGYEQFKQKAMKLYKSTYDALAHICFEVKACDMSHSEFNNKATLYIGGWLFIKQKEESTSILRIFPKYLYVSEISAR